MLDPSRFPPDKWEDLSYWEQICLLPEEEQEEILRDLVRRGVDLNSPEITFRRKQKEVIEAIERVILFAGGRGTGKLLSLHTKVPTPLGEVFIRDISVGNVVLDEHGKPCNVLAVYDAYPERAWKIEFSDGSVIIAGGEHQWVTLSNAEAQKGIKENWAKKQPTTTDDIVSNFNVGHNIPLPLGGVITITSVFPVPIEPMRCLTVDSPNSMYLVSEGMIPTHNTRVGGAWANEKAKQNPGCIIHFVGRTVADVRDVMIKGESGLLAYAPKDFLPIYTPSTRSIEWPNGSKGLTFSADAPDQLRGPQSHFTWADELAAYPQKPDASGANTWDQIEFSTRLGENPQILGTTTPKRVPVMRELFSRAETGKNTKLVQGSSWENRSNLSREYMEYIFNRFSGTHLERQELYGELIGDSPGALWKSDDFIYQKPPTDQELITVIGVDPAVTYGNDDTGIVVACSDINPDQYKRQAWVLEDQTMNSPVEVWGRKVVELQREYSQVSDHNPRGIPAIIVVEKNQGGDLLKALFKAEGLEYTAPVVDVSARLSKSQRAEPVVMAYRQGRVFHAEDMPLLQDEQTAWEPGVSKYSPGRIDALVWAIASLLVDTRPIARWAPILVSDHPNYGSQLLNGVSPAWKRDRGIKTGFGVAPWRR